MFTRFFGTEFRFWKKFEFNIAKHNGFGYVILFLVRFSNFNGLQFKNDR